MLKIRKILLRGDNVKDALVEFEQGANVLAGESDTGKSYLVQCLDFILGAEKLKFLKQAAPYKNLFVEFENSKNEFLTLVRPLAGGKLRAYQSRIQDISGAGDTIDPKRAGKSIRPDVTSVFLPFAGIEEAQLRKNVHGEAQRLSVRTLAPLFLIDEVSIIDEYSPILGRPGYDKTTLKRTFSYLLTGVDDKDIVANETNEIIKTRLKAKLEVVAEMLAPLEVRYKGVVPVESSADEDATEVRIGQLSEMLNGFGHVQGVIQQGVQELTKVHLKAESQLLGISELRNRYALLDDRYSSDLERLDFITEGAYFINSLQDVNCPLCDQMMPGHEHPTGDSPTLRQSAIAEASKIKAHKHDLASAISDIDAKRAIVYAEKEDAHAQIQELQNQLTSDVGPKIVEAMKQYENLVDERTGREARRLDNERWTSLLKLKDELESEIASSAVPKQTWNGISPFSLREFCQEIEMVLRDWTWSANPRVEFDEKAYDIVVDGQPRNSHGKGVRAILYSAFTIGLLRYCAAKGRPHPGVVVIDSPLTSFRKKGSQKISGADGQVTAGVEAAFWNSLKSVSKNVQIIVIENKEPPADVSKAVHYEWFAGEDAKDGERAGLIP
jgi:hypothetical protein